MTKRISLWASPRNISTAMMYSFAQRTDCTVLDEPLYGYYLDNTSAKEYHPGAEEIIASMEIEKEKLKSYLLGDFATPYVFFKNMTHHLPSFDESIVLEMDNIILTRNPKEMIASFSKVIAAPKLEDLGYQQQVTLLDYLLKHNKPPLVVESGQFLQDPKAGLQRICSFLNLPFEENMLTWPAGARKEDGIWAKYWYDAVHQSTGFTKKERPEIILPDQLEDLYQQCLPYYEQLAALA